MQDTDSDAQKVDEMTLSDADWAAIDALAVGPTISLEAIYRAGKAAGVAAERERCAARTKRR